VACQTEVDIPGARFTTEETGQIIPLPQGDAIRRRVSIW
jgi:hypothetical protein